MSKAACADLRQGHGHSFSRASPSGARRLLVELNFPDDLACVGLPGGNRQLISKRRHDLQGVLLVSDIRCTELAPTPAANRRQLEAARGPLCRHAVTARSSAVATIERRRGMGLHSCSGEM